MPIVKTETFSQTIARRLTGQKEAPKREVNPVKAAADAIPLGLDDLKAGVDLPRIEVVVTMKNDIVAVIEAHINALIVSPEKKVLYLESACSSDSSAHALMGCVMDENGSKEWKYFKPAAVKEYTGLLGPARGSCNDISKEVHGFNRRIHHVAIIDKSGDLILSKDNESLWQKLRTMMSCPTLSEWGAAVMTDVLDSGILVRCESFGIDNKFTPYVIAGETAGAEFDQIIGAHVRRIGGIPKRGANDVKNVA